MIFISISVPQNPPVVEVVIHLMSIFKVLILVTIQLAETVIWTRRCELGTGIPAELGGLGVFRYPKYLVYLRHHCCVCMLCEGIISPPCCILNLLAYMVLLYIGLSFVYQVVPLPVFLVREWEVSQSLRRRCHTLLVAHHPNSMPLVLVAAWQNSNKPLPLVYPQKIQATSMCNPGVQNHYKIIVACII
jgi:hypothetical protein